jgi:hypothetical protein
LLGLVISISFVVKFAIGHPDVYLFTFVDWQSKMQISRLGVERQIETYILCEECTTTSSYENTIATVG